MAKQFGLMDTKEENQVVAIVEDIWIVASVHNKLPHYLGQSESNNNTLKINELSLLLCYTKQEIIDEKYSETYSIS